jgi:hypothetical protein
MPEPSELPVNDRKRPVTGLRRKASPVTSIVRESAEGSVHANK